MFCSLTNLSILNVTAGQEYKYEYELQPNRKAIAHCPTCRAPYQRSSKGIRKGVIQEDQHLWKWKDGILEDGAKDIKALTWDALSLNPVFHYSTIPLFRYGWACKDIIPSSRETKCLHDVHIELTIVTFYSNCIQVFFFINVIIVAEI